ncbi:MAG: N-acetylmuramoyl-L-alanine amidase [Alphaproteobacteria bacterium]|nr:N-acetylmuramoyl-L-alanine amidase [Alphaproteobacteria bacterium]
MMGRLWRYSALIVAAALMVPGVALPARAKPAGDVLSMRVETPAGDRQRLVIELSVPVEFRVFPLAEPDRLVIDLPEANWRMPKGAPAGLMVNGAPAGPIQGLRYGLFRPGLSRIVLDLARPALVGEAHLEGPTGSSGAGRPQVWRVVIDISAAERRQFDAAVLADQAERQAALNGASAPTPGPSTNERVEPAVAPPPQAEGRKTPSAPKPPTRAAPGNRPVIAIDPGHGGVDPGAISVSGQYEKHITLIYAQELKRTIEASGRYRVVLTRIRDETLALRQRIAIARAAGAELFISLHADAIRQTSLRGGSVYTLSDQASDAEADALAQRENKADLIAGVDLSDEPPAVAGILIELAQRETRGHAARFARLLLTELDRENASLLKKGHRSAGFAVLKAPDVPSVLFELGYLSNRQDEALIRQEKHRKHIALAVLRAADRFFQGGVERSSTDSP